METMETQKELKLSIKFNNHASMQKRTWNSNVTADELQAPPNEFEE